MKNKWTLLPWGPMDGVISVLTFGEKKHGKDRWKETGVQAYIDAAVRHISEYNQGVTADHETGESPLAHAVADLLFAMAPRDKEELKKTIHIEELSAEGAYGLTDSVLDWANWIATDKGGITYAYEAEPSLSSTTWVPAEDTRYCSIGNSMGVDDWTKTKRRINRDTEEIHIGELAYWDVYGGTTDIPEWANWIATDADGGRYAYEGEPYAVGAYGEWDSEGHILRIDQLAAPEDWAKTKRRIIREEKEIHIDDLSTNVPDWATWIATNGNGEAWVYEGEPTRGDQEWLVLAGRCLPIFTYVRPPVDWTQTKQRIRR